MIELTQNEFEEFKKDYAVYGTHTKSDKYLNEQTVMDDLPKGIIHTMWHPVTDAFTVAEYGRSVSTMLYCIIYEDPGVDYGDVIEIRGKQYEVVGVKYFNTHTRLEVQKKKA